jgi:hypothetical protein
MTKPIACTLVSSDLADQRRRWHELAERTKVERHEVPNGLRLAFAPAPGVAEALEALVAVERECCAFAEWTLVDTVLEITADEEAVPVVRGMFAGF